MEDHDTFITDQLCETTDIDYPKWLPGSVLYETRAGSHAYGVDGPDSDLDIVGFCIPPKEVVFPHLRGEIPLFGDQKQRFKKFRAHNIDAPHIYDRGPIDLTMFSIPRYFHQLRKNNPNWLETIFTPKEVVETCHPIAEKVRDNATAFLNQRASDSFGGLARSQLSKMRKRDRKPERLYKYAYHAVRGVEEGIQIYEEGSLDVRAFQETLREVKSGGWTLDEVEDYVEGRMDRLDELDNREDLPIPDYPDMERLKLLLLECMEDYYGSIDECIRYGPYPKSSNGSVNL